MFKALSYSVCHQNLKITQWGRYHYSLQMLWGNSPGRGGTHQILLKEATNQQNAICQVFCSWPIWYRQCYLQAIFATHPGFGFQRFFFPLGFWHTMFHGWSMTSALPLGIPRLAWLFASRFWRVDSLLLTDIGFVWLHSVHWEHTTIFPILWLRRLRSREVKWLP